MHIIILGIVGILVFFFFVLPLLKKLLAVLQNFLGGLLGVVISLAIFAVVIGLCIMFPPLIIVILLVVFFSGSGSKGAVKK